MTVQVLLSAEDDDFHPSGTDPWWTETAWYSLEAPERGLSLCVYPLFRPNIGVASLAVFVWDARGGTPWSCRYWNFRWNLPMPAGRLTALDFEGLQYRTIDPLKRYDVRFADGNGFSFDLEWAALGEPWIKTGGEMLGADLAKPGTVRTGHFEQACSVSGDLLLDGERIALDCVGMRDRSWSPRPDRNARGSLFHCYGMSRTDGHFVVNRARADGGPIDDWRPSSGYLSRDGEMVDIERARLRIAERSPAGEARRVALEAFDKAGRRLEVTGQCANLLVVNFNPNLFARFQQTHWEGEDGAFVGEYMSPVTRDGSPDA